jgi:hypothetical protein
MGSLRAGQAEVEGGNPMAEGTHASPGTGTGSPISADGQAGADERRFRLMAIVAGALLLPEVLTHVLLAFAIPSYQGIWQSMGGEVPTFTAVLFAMGPWFGLVLVALDVLIFWGCYVLARRYWIGLLFVPLFAGAIVWGLSTLALNVPVSQGIIQTR